MQESNKASSFSLRVTFEKDKFIACMTYFSLVAYLNIRFCREKTKDGGKKYSQQCNLLFYHQSYQLWTCLLRCV